ncbi:hypothetical protein ACIBO9_39435 [Streptomyces prunicolor]|uniref:hypothetical protein n=1 Tax=Streptomyces prunicolor TaxID=67348 RepID=UPI0037D0136C
MSIPDIAAVPEQGTHQQPVARLRHSRGLHRYRKFQKYRKHAIVSTVSALLLAAVALLFGPLGVLPGAQAAPGYVCPGGNDSGEGSSSGQGTCPNLYNDDLLSQRAFPRDLYRGDSRPPGEIFSTGFTARGTNYDLQAHVQGDRAGNSGYISTTGTLGVSETFARSQGLRNLDSVAAQPRCSTGRLAFYSFIPGLGNFLMERCENGQITAESFVYTIDPVWARDALYVPDQVRGNAALQRYASQDEWAYVHLIPNYAITGVRIYRMTAHATRGYVNPRSITFGFDRFVPNPNHLHRLYQPANDPPAHWNSQTYLNTPSLPANPYNRGCSAITRCRD